MHLREAGLRIDFPRGAVTIPTRITVTALRGDNVAYRFEPHGIQFKRPVTLRQSLHRTAAWNDDDLADHLNGSYFERLIVDSTRTFARSLERRAGSLKDSKAALEFTIEHFSGYMVSVGDGEVGIKVEVTIDITPH